MSEITAPALAGTTEVAPLVNPVFISDLHLAPEHPKTLMQFLRFMKTQVPYYEELVILGDLFDYWIGDDTIDTAAPIVKALAYASSIGKRVLITPGNRDVMLGPGFAAACGATLLAPEVTVECMGRRFLLSHGDEWCTKDTEYQKFRAMTRDPQWQIGALSLPLEKRMEIARQARSQSEGTKVKKTAEMMDVVDVEVYKAAKAAGADVVIHGHTHKPASHELAEIERWVLPDWDLDSGAGRDHWGYIRTVDGKRLQIIM
ncbi:UDP-2,3-diacylglucosamine diphosphatase [Mesosutterella sp. OilRF-GAM-744-9]|uniref:UDP-2,3-diacylglucosamine hydrolase n=1 Tax=Mesosutterella porci TaxID=2915351 RepID=A0ABS9MPA7_9BURK|nr:UDP-2,3-diacylglucosamine diphosphatase [Mesosutterella sp. oilRF-744-WT-GAM-9]MCG5030453.1 UDP-2,3-diacylglucosamine diphosphatase [Mesosutterella sp. oilRF-744-WT-GAM-9]MCI6530573.1 UDP-2,3-diacylglucosamine diphosphatase [Mesosutterella sp.]